jgi:heptaprenyl diphosphate synthase
LRDSSRVRRIAGTGLLFALALVLQFVESLVPSPFPMAPGIKLGLSNIVTMFCLFSVGLKEALFIAVLKGLFAFITRGPAAGILSLAGGLLSVLLMTAVQKLGQSDGITSITGAVGHNLGQLAAECVMMKSAAALYYGPLLIVSGVVMGTVTAYVLHVLKPYLEKLRGTDKTE